MNKEILKCYIDTIILNILNKNDSYGYLIIKNISKKSGNKLDIQNAAIYLAFKRMEKDKLITSYWIDSELGIRRKIYSITKEGKEYLKNKKKEWQSNKSILENLLGDN